jgi:hypothetical protein
MPQELFFIDGVHRVITAEAEASQRVDLQEQEQKELAGFLTPLQRAKYFALEQQVRQRVNQSGRRRCRGVADAWGAGRVRPCP